MKRENKCEVEIRNITIAAGMDCLTIGVPGSGGQVKITGDFSKGAEFRAKMVQAIKLREEARSLGDWSE